MVRLHPIVALSPLAVLAALLAVRPAPAAPDGVAPRGEVTVTRHDGRLRVETGGELFTEYVYEGHPKPILYPVLGPRGVRMTRHYPMKEGVEGEASDHRHHRSLWFAHDRVNGVDFWAEDGTIEQTEILEIVSGEPRAKLRTRNRWAGPDGETVLEDERTIGFFATDDARFIDYEVKLMATEGEVVFGDTKEGTMAIRTHPALRLENDPGRGVTGAKGHALNSEGHRDRELWGKRARWVDFWAPVEGHTLGVAILDHPSNPRHPTWWHARHYGLIAANAFGVHNFEDKPRGTGDYTIPAGESRTFRYRFIFHEGDAESFDVAGHWRRWAGEAAGTKEE